MPDDHYDVIVVGSGPGGAALASRLAPTGKRILILERGQYLPREQANWNANAVFRDGRYRADETWRDKAGESFAPMLHYWVGGNSKMYGSALLRLRREDFSELRHGDGVSPAWPIGYDDLDPYYLEAERQFHVHGKRGEDPNEPNAEAPFPFEPIEHEPAIAALSDGLARQGLRPFHLPLGILLDQKPGTPQPTRDSTCIRCGAFDGFPCLTGGKADAEVACIQPMLRDHANVTLLTGAYVERLETDASGRTITSVAVVRAGRAERYAADVVVVAAGALNSALLFLRSANAAHPNGLANGSDQVGRNYMRHVNSVMLALSRRPNETIFQKTLGLTDFYFGTKDWPHPMGLVQMCGKVHGEQVQAAALPAWLGFLPDVPFKMMSRHAIDFWLTSEDLPNPDNRVTIDRDGTVRLALAESNLEAHTRLQAEMQRAMDASAGSPGLADRYVYLKKMIAIEGTSHQAGTMRFGTDPRRSVLDLDCKTHEIDNLYVTDSSCFPSVGAINPTLTIVANAMRVGDHLKTRLGARIPELAAGAF